MLLSHCLSRSAAFHLPNPRSEKSLSLMRWINALKLALRFRGQG